MTPSSGPFALVDRSGSNEAAVGLPGSDSAKPGGESDFAICRAGAARCLDAGARADPAVLRTALGTQPSVSGSRAFSPLPFEGLRLDLNRSVIASQVLERRRGTICCGTISSSEHRQNGKTRLASMAQAGNLSTGPACAELSPGLRSPTFPVRTPQNQSLAWWANNIHCAVRRVRSVGWLRSISLR
jgi:hypothetical protein